MIGGIMSDSEYQNYLRVESRRKTVKLAPGQVIEDGEFLERVKHVLRKNETQMQFIARTGLGPGQAKTMSKAQISVFVHASEERAANDPIVAQG